MGSFDVWTELDARGYEACLRLGEGVYSAGVEVVATAAYEALAFRMEHPEVGWVLRVTRDGNLVRLSEHASMAACKWAAKRAIRTAEALRVDQRLTPE